MSEEKKNATTDADRLWFLRECVEGLRGVTGDRYDHAVEIARERHHDEPSEQDELDGFRRMIDRAIRNERRIADETDGPSAYGTFDREPGVYAPALAALLAEFEGRRLLDLPESPDPRRLLTNAGDAIRMLESRRPRAQQNESGREAWDIAALAAAYALLRAVEAARRTP